MNTNVRIVMSQERQAELRRYLNEESCPCGCVFLGSERSQVCFQHDSEARVRRYIGGDDLLRVLHEEPDEADTPIDLSPAELTEYESTLQSFYAWQVRFREAVNEDWRKRNTTERGGHRE